MPEWKGQRVRVAARLVPKFLWMTASIDVFVGGQRVICTGGQLKILGRCREKFTLPSGGLHDVELAWSPDERYSFAYTLSIDGVPVENSSVHAENWWMASLIPAVIFFGFLAYTMLRISGVTLPALPQD